MRKLILSLFILAGTVVFVQSQNADFVAPEANASGYGYTYHSYNYKLYIPRIKAIKVHIPVYKPVIKHTYNHYPKIHIPVIDYHKSKYTPKSKPCYYNCGGQHSYPSSSSSSSSYSSSSSSSSQQPQPQYGCIDVYKEAYDVFGNTLSVVPQFTFKLDNNQTALNTSNGLSRFNNVSVGWHTVTEILPSGWNLINVTPANGYVYVQAGNNCVAVVFKNQQNIPTSSSSSSSSYGYSNYQADMTYYNQQDDSNNYNNSNQYQNDYSNSYDNSNQYQNQNTNQPSNSNPYETDVSSYYNY